MHETAQPLRLNYSLIVAETEQGLALDVADAEPITVQGDYQLLLQLLAAVDGGKDESAIVEAMAGQYGADQVRQAVTFAWSRNLIKSVTNEDLIRSGRLGKWDRQIRNFTNLSGVSDDEAVSFHQRLAGAHVLVFGVGGVGGYVASASAMIGIGRITIVDFDTIELSNTSRQVLYTEADLGRAKLDVAMEELTRRAPRAQIHAINTEVVDGQSMTELLTAAESANGPIDLLILCADQPRGEITHIVDGACAVTGTAVLMCSPHDFSHVSVGPLIIPGVTPSYGDMFPRDALRTNDPLVRAVNARFVASIMEPYNGLAAKMALVEAVKFLTGYAKPFVLGRVVDVDTADWSVSVHELG